MQNCVDIKENRPLEEDELHEDLDVWIEIEKCPRLYQERFEDCRPFGRVLCYTFSSGAVLSAGSYGYVWRAWLNKPTEEERRKNKWT